MADGATDYPSSILRNLSHPAFHTRAEGENSSYQALSSLSTLFTIAALWFIFVICLGFLATPARALDPGKRLTQYVHTSWRTQDGSLPAGMFSIAQTSDGFLWTLSLSGDIYRFDGTRFSSGHVPATLANHPAGKIFAARAGGLWVVANELVHLQNGVAASHFDLKGLHGYQSIYEDPDGSLWVGLRTPEAPLCHITEHSIKCFGQQDGVPASEINAIVSDGYGGLWLGGESALVHWHRGDASENYPTKGSITSLARTRDGRLWVGFEDEGSGRGLEQLQKGVLKPYVTAGFDGTKVSVTNLMVDHDGNVWAATDGKGIFKIQDNGVEQYRRTDGLSGDSAWAVFEDRESGIWVGTTSGIDNFRDSSIVTFSVAEGLGKDLAAGVLASRDGTIYVANNGSLDRIKNGIVSSIRKSKGLPGEQVAAMLEDHAGNIWIGVDDKLFTLRGDRFRRIPEPDGKPLGMVVALTEDRDGNVWAECAGRPRKLVRIHDFKVKEVFADSQVPPGHDLAPDPKGGIWILTSKGSLAHLQNGRVAATVPLDPRSSALNPKLIVQEDGSILVNSENGLLGWRGGKLQRLTTKNGLPCDFVISFVQDTESRWWLYTRCGVVEFSNSELQKWWADSDTIIQNRVFDRYDGAQPNIGSFNQAVSAPDGKVWFASGVVVQMVDPSKLSRKMMPAPAYIETVSADRKELAVVENLKVPARTRDLHIEYTSPTLLIPQRAKFRYRLDGFDRDWHDAGNRREAFYQNLRPGNYSFRVIASNSEGAWSDSAGTLDFTVAPAYYQTNWFYAFCALLSIALLWAMYRFRVRQLHHQFEMSLDVRVAERTRIARELHDTLLQSAHGILLSFQTVSQLLPGRPEEAKQRLDLAIDQTADFITQARDEVQGLRDSTVQENNLALAITMLGEELPKPNGHQPKLSVAVEGKPRNLHPILRDEVYKIAAEALRNAFSHAEARQVEVELRYDDEQFRLRVRDDGKGIDPGVLASQGSEGHYGLPGMRERATMIEGKLTIWSEVDAGTELELHLPARKAYATTARNSWRFRDFHQQIERNDYERASITNSNSRG